MSAVYNNVENITKEAVELNNSYSSKSSSFGVNAGAAIGYGHKMQATGNGGSVSLGRSSQNTVETVYHNGSFANVNEVHNNTGTMIVSGFNQETRDKEGTARNTVTRNATTKETAGDTVNRDMSRANEITKDKSSTVNVNVESQTIQYAANPSKFKEEGKAKDETRDIGRATNEYFKDKYKDDSTRITLTSEGAIDTSKLGTNVGDDVIVPQKYWGVNNFPAADNKKKVKSSFEEVYNKLYKKNENFYEKIDWTEYEKNFIYRERINYYYLLSLNTVKNINEFNKNKGDFVEMSETEALFHNISGNKIKINGNLNRKFVNPSNGKEVVLNSTLNKIVTDVDNRGTFNYYTYKNDNWLNRLMTFGDKAFHSIDIKNWAKKK